MHSHSASPNGDHDPDIIHVPSPTDAPFVHRQYPLEQFPFEQPDADASGIVALHEDTSNGGTGSLTVSSLSSVPPHHCCSAIQIPEAVIPGFPLQVRVTPSPRRSSSWSAQQGEIVEEVERTIITQRPCGCVFTVGTNDDGAVSTILAHRCGPCAARAHRASDPTRASRPDPSRAQEPTVLDDPRPDAAPGGGGA